MHWLIAIKEDLSGCYMWKTKSHVQFRIIIHSWKKDRNEIIPFSVDAIPTKNELYLFNNNY